ncbi:MAG: hypothetical protein C0183_17840 [Roseiflexus castenholzii]|nr:MAG: hypothetical protein C0183_17840 [Roseiflexus castenholzii]
MMRAKKPRTPDHGRRVNVPGPQDETLQTQCDELLSPAISAQAAFYRSVQLRDRIVNLPLMIAVMLAMVWRPIPSVCALTRTLKRAGVLWMGPVNVAQPAVSQRWLTCSADWFRQVCSSVLPG